ncbi:glycoside hydrolase family 16 protein [Novosphingobium sp. PC22D]|uniref:glycoside hydrolase family 16 protein n=1 Tax=Novosphingobium sp. PC22D TaxID=1962403 RepID=UPI0014388B26|nr:glycoside hydrolase family 16 protein [Novosphingobium sp. PC22D]
MGAPLLRVSCIALAMPFALLAAYGLQPLQGEEVGKRLDRSKLELVFAEEFDEPISFYDVEHAPEGRWKTNFRHGVQDPASPIAWQARTLVPNEELQYYGDPFRDANPFEWRPGELTIVATRSEVGAPHGLPYLSGLITTETSFEQTYGYFEARVTMPVGKGLWPAFWLIPGLVPQPEPGAPQPIREVDVFENIGKDGEVYASVHREEDGRHITDNQRIPVDTVTEPHTYGVLVGRNTITWYVDDVAVKESPNVDFHKPAHMLLNLAVGGDWPGNPDATTRFPARMTIDWVRAYRLKGPAS